MAKDKVKKPSFFKRLRDKIESFFVSDKLTFVGKVYMFMIYLAGCGFFGICACSIINTIIYLIVGAANAAIGAIPAVEEGEAAAAAAVKVAASDCLVGASTVSWILFVIPGIVFIILTFIEMYINTENSESILEKDYNAD